MAEPVRRDAGVRALDRVLLRHGPDRLAACGRARAPRPERLARAPALEGDLCGRAVGLHDSRQHGLARPGEHAAQRGEELRDVHPHRPDRDLPVDGHRLCRHRVRVAAEDRHGGAVQVAQVDEARRERGLLRILDRVGQFPRHGPIATGVLVGLDDLDERDGRAPAFREAPEQASQTGEQEQYERGAAPGSGPSATRCAKLSSTEPMISPGSRSAASLSAMSCPTMPWRRISPLISPCGWVATDL